MLIALNVSNEKTLYELLFANRRMLVYADVELFPVEYTNRVIPAFLRREIVIFIRGDHLLNRRLPISW